MKQYFTYNDIHKTIAKLAGRLEKSGFEPDLIVAIGSGGFIPARIMRSYIGKPIFTVGIAYYDADNRPTDAPQKIQWIYEVEEQLQGKKILLIDEVDDSRATLAYCVRELLAHEPSEIAVMVLHNKDKEKTDELPKTVTHYFHGEELEDVWIVYPWDALDIEDHDQHAKKG